MPPPSTHLRLLTRTQLFDACKYTTEMKAAVATEAAVKAEARAVATAAARAVATEAAVKAEARAVATAAAKVK